MVSLAETLSITSLSRRGYASVNLPGSSVGHTANGPAVPRLSAARADRREQSSTLCSVQLDRRENHPQPRTHRRF